ncbi:substrate-binding domain-containing protein [Deinococcus cellulosilyticus]|uniref:LacI family transcriptional regulator n=1 Tax=Deinococcus cellulosilyticus (strain DSM 18568 / NBRC 106333 / KACC 11606 / 5516J-15) TaxID=1223518 RepID=A0A511N221_DEIC1|nr:substrate-binding domain-containing protein [Deinococcus cellulosilyticus]GEM46904.1 LacI family transcriptional regulator [Deinococcus cellulosilyticus NBRC 106333 = KACC 11606]
MSQALTAALQTLRSTSGHMDASPRKQRPDAPGFTSHETHAASCTIGVLVDSISDPVRCMMMQGIEQAALAGNCIPLYSAEPWSAEVDAVLILDDRITDDSLMQLAEVIPMVVLGRRVKGLEKQCLWVEQSHAIREAVLHLLGQGHQKLAFVCETEDEKVAFQEALKGMGLSPENAVITGCTGSAEAQAATLKLLEQGRTFTALLAASDLLAYGARQALQQAKMDVPTDVALMGIGDLPFSAYLTPPLSSVGIPWVDLAREATFALLKRVNGLPARVPEVTLQVQRRESTAN